MRHHKDIRRRAQRILAAARVAVFPKRYPEQAFELLRILSRYLLPRYALSSPFVDWYSDEDLRRHQKRFDDSDPKLHRLFTLQQILQLVRNVEGDTAEVGVLFGSSSAIICRANAESAREKVHFVFDSFEGLSDPQELDGFYWQSGDLAVSTSGLLLSSEDGNFVVKKGWVPVRFQEVEDRRFSFVHIDVDLFEPTDAAVRFFGPRMSKGGVLLCDDYGSTRCPGATRAINCWLTETGRAWVALPGGGGFTIFE